MQILYGQSLVTGAALLFVIASPNLYFVKSQQPMSQAALPSKPFQQILQEAREERSRIFRKMITKPLEGYFTDNPHTLMRCWFYLATFSSIVGGMGWLDTMFFR